MRLQIFDIRQINNIFIQVDNCIKKTNLFRGGSHSSAVFAGLFFPLDKLLQNAKYNSPLFLYDLTTKKTTEILKEAPRLCCPVTNNPH